MSPQLRKLQMFLLIKCLFYSIVAHGLDPDRAITQYAVKHWDADSGLPQNVVHAVIQTRDRYIWLATTGGAVRFDGTKFTVFTKKHGLPNTYLARIFEDKDGTLWVGSYGGGVCRYDNGKFKEVPSYDGTSFSYITGFEQDDSGVIWVATRRGLARIDHGKIRLETATPEINGVPLSSLARDDSGNLYIGGREGVFRRYKDKVERIPEISSSINVHSLHWKNGVLWIGTKDSVIKLSKTGLEKYELTSGAHPIRAIYQDSSGSVWIGTEGVGLRRLTNGKIESAPNIPEFQGNVVLSIVEDHEGNLWMATEAGLNRMKDGAIVPIGKEEGLSPEFVWTVMEDRDGRIWTGTNEIGLAVIDQNTVKTFSVRDGLSVPSVTGLMQSRSGDLWVGTQQGGLNLFRNGKFQQFPQKARLAGNYISALLEDNDGTIWLGTFAQGIFRLKDESIVQYTKTQGLPSNTIHCILQTPEGDLWFGTDEGPAVWKNGAIHVYDKDNIAGKGIYHLYQDPEGTIWLGTLGWGLYCYRQGKFFSFQEKDGLYDDVIAAILEDDSGNLWMTGNNTISRIPKKQLYELIEKKRTFIEPLVYGRDDGMRTGDCSGGYQPAGWRSRDGRLWFATVRGLVVIDPRKIQLNRKVPPVYITQIIINDREVSNPSESETLTFKPGKGKLEFHYTALSYKAPEKNRFRYKLEGFDSDWVDGGSRKIAYYTNIPAGSYRFMVIACNNDAIWNEKGAKVGFYLEPYIYQTRSFYLLCFIATFVAAFGIYRLRLRQVRKRFEAVLAERSRISRELHDTVAQNISTVVVQLDAAGELFRQVPEESLKFLKQAQELARESVKEARKVVWQLRDDPPLEHDFATSLKRAASRIADQKNIPVYMRKQGETIHLSLEKEDEILRICQEAVWNAVKHANPDRIDLELTFERNEIRLCVRDNGIGFNRADPPPQGHFGLAGMEERAKSLGADLDIHSDQGSGTEVRLHIRIP